MQLNRGVQVPACLPVPVEVRSHVQHDVLPCIGLDTPIDLISGHIEGQRSSPCSPAVHRLRVVCAVQPERIVVQQLERTVAIDTLPDDIAVEIQRPEDRPAKFQTPVPVGGVDPLISSHQMEVDHVGPAQEPQIVVVEERVDDPEGGVEEEIPALFGQRETRGIA